MAIIATEKVLTLDWWKPAAKLKVGDYVFDRNGKPVQIKLIQQYRVEDCYRVMFDDHLTLSGDGKLGFPMEDIKYRKRLCSYKGHFKFRRPLKHIIIDNLTELPLKNNRNRSVYSVPTTQPLQFPYQDLPVPPFVFGYWFFNRTPTQKLTVETEKQEEIIQRFKDYGYKIILGSKKPYNRREFTVKPSIESQLVPNIPSVVPYNYLLANTEQRIELLSGIIMAKRAQYNQKADRFGITAKNLNTITRIQSLVESLGCKTIIEHEENNSNYSISFRSRHSLVSNQASPPVKVHHARRYVSKISKLPAQLCVHIETTSEDSTILVGEGFIPCR